MPQFIITGVPPYDGTYEIPAGGYTNREYSIIKRISGVRAGELEEASQAGDTDVLVGLAVVLLNRHGVLNVQEDLLWNATESNFDVVKTPEDKAQEDADRPLPSGDQSGTDGGSKSEPDEPPKPTADEQSSGGNGSPAGESNLVTLVPSGSPGSETSADSDPPTSET